MLVATLTAAAALSIGSSGEGNLCRTAMSLARELICVETARGVALAPTSDRAHELAHFGLAAEARFQRHFGREPVTYALIDYDGRSPIGDLQGRLNQAGFKRTLPWLSRQAYADALREATRQMVNNLASAQQLTTEQKSTLLAEEMSRAERGLSTFEMDSFEAAVVPHEIGHGWYTEAFWPSFVMDRLGHYGSPSPDWLDETAAILMESGDSAEERRYHFAETYRGRDANVCPSELLDLRTFLLRDHPERANNIANAPNGSNEISIRVVQPETNGMRSGARYYEQGRVFADFIIDRTGDRAIFGAIGEAFGRGQSLEGWLAAAGPSKNLPATISELEEQWRSWLQNRFGTPGAELGSSSTCRRAQQ